MTGTPILPRPQSQFVDASGRPTIEFYNLLRQIVNSLRDGTFSGLQDQINLIAIALGSPDGSVDGLADLAALLNSKQNTDEDLTAISNMVDIGLAVRVADNYWIARSIAGTAGEIDVANGDGLPGNPALSLATVADAGGGTLQKTAFDAKGRKTGSSAATTDDLPEGATNLYFTTARVRATILTGLSTASSAVVAATDTILVGIGKLQAQISGLIIQTITDGDTTHAPSGDAVFDALALKAALASPALTGTPSAPTAVGGTNTTQLATTEFVQAAITQRVILAADAAHGLNLNFEDVGGLSFTADANSTYKFKFHVAYTVNSTALGTAWSINGPASATMNYNTQWSLSTTDTSSNFGIIAYDTGAANATSRSTAGNSAVVEGVIKTGATAGTVVLRFKQETAVLDDVVTAKAGLSYLEYQKIAG